MKYKYNYKFENKDVRDFKFKKFSKTIMNLPKTFDLCNLPNVLNQESLGSCTANAASNALRYCLKKEKQKKNILEFQPSRLYIYYFSRLIENTICEDSGVVIRNVMKAISKYGACSSDDWPYDISKFTYKPSNNCIKQGKDHIKGFTYLSVNQTEQDLKSTLFKGYPIICGVQVFESFESETSLKTGNIPLPKNGEEVYGGHCILITGYDDNLKLFKFQNSWGENVGNKGYFTIPYEYILDSLKASDFWTILFFN